MASPALLSAGAGMAGQPLTAATNNPGAVASGQAVARNVQAMPWLDYSSVAVPDSHALVLWWAQYLWLTDGNYQSAMRRVPSHFITELEFPDLETGEENAYKDFLEGPFDWRAQAQMTGEDTAGMGNCIRTPYIPIRRSLGCANPRCAFEQPIERVDYRIEFQSTGVMWQRKHPCPACGNNAPYRLLDRTDPDIKKVKLIRHSPFDIEIAYNPFSDAKNIYRKISTDERRDILTGKRIFIETTPIEYLEAVARNGTLLLEPDMVMHSAISTITGVKMRGWGMPPSIAAFRTGWLQQVVNRTDQAVQLDYTTGMRLISPAQTPGGMDPLQVEGMNMFAQRMGAIIAGHRANPASYHTVPYPVTYQFAGGEGAALLPPDKLKFRHQEYLNQLGIPLEYHQMNLAAQAAPLALALFEQAWHIIPSTIERQLQWVLDCSADRYGLRRTRVKLQRTTVSYDLARKQMLAQLMAANQVSPQTALAPLGVQADEEAKKVMKQQRYVAKLQEEAAKDQERDQEMGALQGLTGAPSASSAMAAAQQPPPGAGTPMGGMPGGGTPGAGGPQATSIDQLSQQADQLAQQLVSMPELDRKQQLRSIKQYNPDLHGLVTSKMEAIRSQAASQGKQQILQGAQAGAQAGAAPA